MPSYQLTRIYNLLSAPQIKLFESLNRRKQWLGELYLTLILSQEDLDYIYSTDPIEQTQNEPITSEINVHYHNNYNDCVDGSYIILVYTPSNIESNHYPDNYPDEYQSPLPNYHDFYAANLLIKPAD